MTPVDLFVLRVSRHTFVAEIKFPIEMKRRKSFNFFFQQVARTSCSIYGYYDELGRGRGRLPVRLSK
jgi:hypothetical protein